MTMFKSLTTAAFAGAALCATAAAATVDVSTTTETVAVGDTFEVRIAYSAETMEEFLSLADFEFTFEEGLFTFVGADFVDGTTGQNQLSLDGDPDSFGQGIFTVTEDILPGEITVSAISENSLDFLGANQADDFSIVTLTFVAEMAGTGDLGLGTLRDFIVETLGGGFGQADILDSFVTVDVVADAVPLPGAAVFLLTGAAGLFARRKMAA